MAERAVSGVTPHSTAWKGGLHIRPGVIAFTGQVGSAAPHAHAAVQVYSCSAGQVAVTDDVLVRPVEAVHK